MLSHESLTRVIIGTAFRAHNLLGPGHLEHVYRNAVAHLLRMKTETSGDKATSLARIRKDPKGYGVLSLAAGTCNFGHAPKHGGIAVGLLVRHAPLVSLRELPTFLL
ncbi:MAG: hypothetical protein FD180_3860 [Planctomycetota bacterium]|nr:MAG: hypothetical protein FD180_3860 [Planctomycetota bacterium]